MKLAFVEGNRPLVALTQNAETIEKRYEALYDRELYRFLPGDVSDAIGAMSGSMFGLSALVAGIASAFDNKAHQTLPPDCTRQPLGVVAAGLALLSALPDEDVAAAITANSPDFVRYGSMTPDRMKILVRSTRERGGSVIGNHATRGVLAVGMAVLSKVGKPEAAISVASIIERMPRDRQQLIARSMRDALAELLPDGL